ncbi:hypothetical protein [Hippea alviniae]|uniref:hypothetical protein n=1 Tax=Hippea alviniae TaxID=1279027 RepID=UPI0003B406F1|nr:hypothetical protein [Hippea alviniae]
MKKKILAVSVLLLYGCSLKPYPALKQFGINENIKQQKVITKDIKIRISSIACPEVFRDLSIYKVRDRTVYMPFPNVSWVDSECSMFENALKKALLKAGFDVVDYGVSRYEILFSLERFNENEDSKTVSVCSDFWLKDEKNDSTLLNFKVCKEKKLKKPSIYAVVNGLNELTRSTIKDSIAKLILYFKR